MIIRPYHLSTARLQKPKPIIRTDRRNMRPISVLMVVIAAFLYQGHIGVAAGQPSVHDDSVTVRNAAISQALAAHRVDTIVGDYWRVIPVGRQDLVKVGGTPLQSCFASYPNRMSAATQNSYKQHSFAYLVSSDMSQANLRGCRSDAVIAKFGQPTLIITVAGTSDAPKEQLLFYENGAQLPRKKAPVTINDEFQASSATGLRPVAPDKLVNRSCPGHRTIVQIVAHEDDDLLFMNPDLLHAIQQGDCVRTIYMTAGDAGSSKFYWLGRERGSEAAYSLLSGAQDMWSGQTVKLGTNRFVAAASPVSSTQLSLLFMHLPDGKPDGQGFANSDFESLAKVVSGEKPTIQSVDGQAVYSDKNLIAALLTLMDAYQPDEVRTQRPINDSNVFGDHSDHLAVGQLAGAAFKKYSAKHPTALLSYYTGYPIRENPANVSGDDLTAKEQSFFTYGQYDGAVCNTIEACFGRADYSDYLQRQYRTDP